MTHLHMCVCLHVCAQVKEVLRADKGITWASCSDTVRKVGFLAGLLNCNAGRLECSPGLLDCRSSGLSRERRER
jgi:hypothetical protein